MFFLPTRDEAVARKIIAKVLIFIPPAVLAVAPPIIINKHEIMMVGDKIFE